MVKSEHGDDNLHCIATIYLFNLFATMPLNLFNVHKNTRYLANEHPVVVTACRTVKSMYNSCLTSGNTGSYKSKTSELDMMKQKLYIIMQQHGTPDFTGVTHKEESLKHGAFISLLLVSYSV